MTKKKNFSLILTNFLVTMTIMPTILTCRKYIIFKFPQKRNISRYFSINNIRSSDNLLSLFKLKQISEINHVKNTRFVSRMTPFSYNQNKLKRKLKSKCDLNLNSFSSNPLINELMEKSPFNYFRNLLKISPYFLLNGEQICLLQEPQEFYEELKVINLRIISQFFISTFY